MRQPITTVLQNGATILAEFKFRDYHVVLCDRGESAQPFVVWDIGPTERKDGKMPCYMGHYFDDNTEARKKFSDRVAYILGVAK